MKKQIWIVALLLINCCSVVGQSKTKSREQLKEYFLCCCIYHGYNSIGIANIDNSKSIYFDILRYKLPALQKVDSLAKVFVNTIEISPYENKNKKGIIILSIEEYKSKRIDEFIKSMDIYMLK